MSKSNLMLGSSSDLVVNSTLKSLYFQYQTAVVLSNGTIESCDFDSPAIAEFKSLVKRDPEKYGFNIKPRLNVKLVPKSQILAHLSGVDTDNVDQQEVSVLQQSETATRAKMILEESVLKGSSDIHIELFKAETRVEVRVDGRMIELRQPIKDYEYGVLLIGYLFNELTDDKDDDFHPSKINNGRFSIPLKTQEGVRATDWRLAYVPAKDSGGQCTLRWLNKDTKIPSLDDIGWETGQVEVMRDFMASASGVCLIAGQTSSGKTTTIAAALNEMKRRGRSINTIEDPVEFDLGVVQTSVTAKQGQDTDFSRFTKALLRHDVDIEMHGEIRDQKGAMSVCRKGETGQLMFSTLHTSSALGIAPTLDVQMHVPTALLAAPELMKLWIYQTLVRKVCTHCGLSLAKVREDWTSKEQAQFASWRKAHNHVPIDALRFRSKEGCQHCVEGESGRTTLIEMIVLDDEDRDYILRQDYLGWQKALIKKGFRSIADHANLKVSRGQVDLFSAAARVDGLFVKTTDEVYGNIWGESEEN